MTISPDKIESFFSSQLGVWANAQSNYSALANVRTKELTVDGMPVKVQFNPARAVSSGAKVDAASIRERKCFLCENNRPSVQTGLDWEKYTILVNPFPIFPRHLTIPDKNHVDQRIQGRIDDMVRLAAALDGYTVFYNGPLCGASAPDHMHFQAGNSDFLPIHDIIADAVLDTVLDTTYGRLFVERDLPLKLFVIDAASPEGAARLFDTLYSALPVPEGEDEPMMNILCQVTPAGTRLLIIPRKKHRPSFYGTDGNGKMMLSPASVDLAGVFITPREDDFIKLDETILRKVYDELCYSTEEIDKIVKTISKPESEPVVTVGLLTGIKFKFNFHGTYLVDDMKVTGPNVVERSQNGDIVWNSDHHTDIVFQATSEDCYFDLEDVVIGIGFHWERKETQSFKGSLKFLGGAELTAINIVPIEEYLRSVISSEMSANASLEFLKSHAVISRSWILAQIHKHEKISMQHQTYESVQLTGGEMVRWYDREDHTLFHVCADDHCQRYQGITRQTTSIISQAVDSTRGLVLVDKDGELCDARFSKCCGGVFEQFESCWEPVHHHYLEARRDSEDENRFPDLIIEDNAREWIFSNPESYCNTHDAKILGQVLNNYDQETTDFYRWCVRYTQDEISTLIKEKSGIDFGKIRALEAIERGTSGRIVRLRIIGENRTMIIGKELEIRRILSASHLYSSAFVVDYEGSDENDYPSVFCIHGAGWGHGVGLCQIGAAVMGDSGKKYDEILFHYFPGASLKTLY